MTATGGFQTVRLNWTNPIDEDLDAVEVWRSTSNDSNTATRIASVGQTASTPSTYVDAKLADTTLYYYWLKTRDFNGNTSAFHVGQFAGVSATTLALATTSIVNGTAAIPGVNAATGPYTLPAAYTDVAIQDAINTVNAGGGGTVYLAAGSYVKAGGTWATLTLKDHVRLLGPLGPLGERTGQTGRGAVLLNNDAVNTLTYATAGSAGLSTTIEGICFEGISTGAHVVLAGVGVQNRIWIRECSFAGKANAILFGDGSYDIWVVGNTFYNQTSHQVWGANTTTSSQQIFLRDNYFSAPTNGFSQLRFDGAALAGFELSNNVFAGANSTQPLVNILNGPLAGMICDNDFEVFNGASQVALQITNGSGVLIYGNTISNGVTGISLIGCTGVEISANRFGTITTAVIIDVTSSNNILGQNSGMTPVTDNSTTTWRMDVANTWSLNGASLKVGKIGLAIDLSGVVSAILKMGSTDLQFYDSAGANARVIFTGAGGIQVGAPTGGDKGAGTINAAINLYKNNSLVVAQSDSGTVTNTMLAGSIDLATKVTGILLAADFPALSGDVTTTAGSLATAIGAAKVTAAMLAVSAKPTLVEKAGSGAGDYTTTSATYADIDATNLAYTVTIPSGANLTVTAFITVQNSANNTACGFAIFDTAVVAETVNEFVAGIRNQQVLTKVITGDGASHTIKLQWKAAAGTSTLSNGTTTFRPRMLFIMSTTN